jgi:hypothetical protein
VTSEKRSSCAAAFELRGGESHGRLPFDRALASHAAGRASNVTERDGVVTKKRFRFRDGFSRSVHESAAIPYAVASRIGAASRGYWLRCKTVPALNGILCSSYSP